MKRKHFLATAVTTIAALTALACGSGGTSSSATGEGDKGPAPAATEKATTTAKIGQTVTLTYDGLGDATTVEITVGNATQHAKEPGEFGSKPEHGTFLALDVTVVCKAGTYHANPFNFKFVATDGTVSEGAFTTGFKPELHGTDLAAGQKVAGKIVFDVPVAAVAGGRIQVDGLGFDHGKPAAYWTL